VSKAELDIQVDFTGGQINDAALRRNDLPAYKTGGEIVQNWRALATGQIIQRPGRSVVHYTNARRGEYFRVSTGQEFIIRFGDNSVQIYDLLGNFISGKIDANRLIWTNNTVDNIVWSTASDNIIICYRDPTTGKTILPYCLFWNRTTLSWSYNDFAFDVSGNVIQQPFYRRASLGVTLAYYATTGDNVKITAANVPVGETVFTPNMVGQYISVVGQQCKINKYIDARNIEVDIIERLPDCVAIFCDDVQNFFPGQICSTTNSNVKMEVGSVDLQKKCVIGVMCNQLIFNANLFPTATSDYLVGPNGQAKLTNTPAFSAAGSPTLQWAEAFMSPLNGYPASVSYDRDRVCFTNFEQAQNAILWSTIGNPFGFWVDSIAAKNNPAAGSNDNSAIFELIAGCPQIYHVLGWQQGQFIFTFRGVYFLPVSAQTPLAPAKLFFEKIADDGISNIRPVTIQDAILFVNQGLNRVGAIRATGSLTRPFLAIDVADLHYDLFNNPVFLAVTTGDGQRPERYVYVVNADGTCVVGKAAFGGEGQPMFVGWAPWTSKGKTEWVTTRGSLVYYTNSYPKNGGGSFYSVEIESSNLYFDFALLVNQDNGNANPPAGKGPFYMLPAGTIISLLNGVRYLGDFPIDANGFVIAGPNAEASLPNVVGGLFTQSVFQPFSYFERVGDRTKRIGVNRIYCNVLNSTDFTIDGKVFTTNQWGETQPSNPQLLNGGYRLRRLGRGWKAPAQLVKHTPGPITICEFTLEVSN
jgi:hypothetical protein